MKRVIFLLIFCHIYLFSDELSLAFIPRDDSPFSLYSPTGTCSIENSGEIWKQNMVLITDGHGGNVQVTAENLPEFSLNDKNLIVWVKPENTKALKDFWIYASNNADFSDRIVFLVSRDRTQLREGQWNRLSFTLSSGSKWGNPDAEHFKFFQFWVNDTGNEPVELSIGPIFLQKTLQDSAVVMTFDDGWKSQVQTAAPIMADYKLKGTAYIIPDLIGTESYMNLADLTNLTENYKWSLGSHYMDRLDDKRRDELTTIFQDQYDWFMRNNFSAHDFAYPNGASGGEVMQIIPSFYRSGRSIIEFNETIPPGNRYNLRVLNIVPPIDFTGLQDRLKVIKAHGELLILVFHKISPESNFETEVSASDFSKLCEIINNSGIPVKTMEELSVNFPELIVDSIPDWSAATLFQPSVTLEKKANLLAEGDPLSVAGPGAPLGVLNKTQLDFSLDWRMVWGLNDAGDPQFYSQLDDLYLYIQNELKEGTLLFASAGIEDVNFDDMSQGEINGSDFYLQSLYMQQKLTDSVTMEAGYFSPDPIHKWLQVTRSAGIESALGQDMTPTSLWIDGKWKGSGPLGVQLGIVPDIIGKAQSGSDLRTLTYQESLAVPNLFSSLWYDTDVLDGEIAAAVNGDALKIAAEGGYYRKFEPYRLSASIGMKYTRGKEFSTYPEWDHLDDTLRLSTGCSLLFPFSLVQLNPGLAYQGVFSNSGTSRHMSGLDFGILYRSLEFYSVITLFDLENLSWGDTAGLETGIILAYKDVKYMTGFTMAGFNTLSGLYNNKDWNEGGVDGIFFRIKATYW